MFGLLYTDNKERQLLPLPLWLAAAKAGFPLPSFGFQRTSRLQPLRFAQRFHPVGPRQGKTGVVQLMGMLKS